MEHTNDTPTARQIAIDHLRERPDYYTRLRAVEDKVANYKLDGERDFQGLDIAVENKKGSTRKWYDPHGKEAGSTLMRADYGYIRGSKGTDGDHVDVYVGDAEDAVEAYLIDQMKKPDFKTFDEQKVMLGFATAAEAKALYLKQYDDPRFFGGMKIMPIQEFKMKVLDKANHGEKIATTAKKTERKKCAGVDSAAVTLELAGQDLGWVENARKVAGSHEDRVTRVANGIDNAGLAAMAIPSAMTLGGKALQRASNPKLKALGEGLEHAAHGTWHHGAEIAGLAAVSPTVSHALAKKIVGPEKTAELTDEKKEKILHGIQAAGVAGGALASGMMVHRLGKGLLKGEGLRAIDRISDRLQLSGAASVMAGGAAGMAREHYKKKREEAKTAGVAHEIGSLLGGVKRVVSRGAGAVEHAATSAASAARGAGAARDGILSRLSHQRASFDAGRLGLPQQFADEGQRLQQYAKGLPPSPVELPMRTHGRVSPPPLPGARPAPPGTGLTPPGPSQAGLARLEQSAGPVNPTASTAIAPTAAPPGAGMVSRIQAGARRAVPYAAALGIGGLGVGYGASQVAKGAWHAMEPEGGPMSIERVAPSTNIVQRY